MSTESLSSRAIQGRLFLRLEHGPAKWVRDLSFHVDSDQMTEEHRWLRMPQPMRQWAGERWVYGLDGDGIVIANVEFEATIALTARELRLDKTAQILARIDGLAGRANAHGAKLLSELIEASESKLCYDGKTFFVTDHVDPSSEASAAGISMSNKISIVIADLPAVMHGTPSKPSVDEISHAVLQAIEQMYGFKDDKGEPMNEGSRRFLVMSPPSMWGAGSAAVAGGDLSAGQASPLEGLAIDGQPVDVTIVPNRRHSWSDRFVVFRNDGNNGDGVRPFIRQEEEPVHVLAIAEGSDQEFMQARRELDGQLRLYVLAACLPGTPHLEGVVMSAEANGVRLTWPG